MAPGIIQASFGPRFGETLVLDDPVEVPSSGLVAMALKKWKHGYVITSIEDGQPEVVIQIARSRTGFWEYNVLDPWVRFDMVARRKPDSDLLVVREVVISQPREITEEDRKRNERSLYDAFKAMWRMS